MKVKLHFTDKELWYMPVGRWLIHKEELQKDYEEERQMAEQGQPVNKPSEFFG